MVKLRELRTSQGWSLKEMGEKIGVSIATLSRIEKSERLNQKHPLDEKSARPMLAAINDVFGKSYSFEDLEGVTIAPPRPGRPKAKQAA